MRLVSLLLLFPSITAAQDLVLDADVPSDAAPYFEVPFTVPEGTVEIEIRHDDMSDENILDWGLRDPDRFRGWGGGNPEPAIVGVDRASRSYTPGPIEAGEWAVLIGQALVVDAPAHYRIEIFFRTTPTLPEQPARMEYVAAAALQPGPRWYAGDFHVHSNESGDASPTLDEIATFAETRGLDFIELSEHNVVSQLDFIVDAQARHPSLLLLPGIEVTTYWGHANAIGATEWIDFRVMSGGDASIDTIASSASVLAINHPVLDLGNSCIGCAWALEDPPGAVSAIEIQNGAYSVTGMLFYDRAIRFWEGRLAAGAHIAVIGGSDDHNAGTGTGMFGSPIGAPTTMVYADELSAAAIAEGVRAGRTVVKLEGPDDPMIELDHNRETIDERQTELRAVVTGGIGATLYFVRNARRLDAIEVDSDPFEATLAITAPGGEVDDRYRCELDVDGDPRVLTSYLWVRATGEPLDAGGNDAGMDTVPGGSCGCRASTRSSPLAFVLFWLLAVLARARHRAS
jgi:hypothetical protein